ncbi:protein translocase subunit SecF [Candidatus Saccharibacteria bacterium]|nr:protein translocase subunit SecF [Candidatus Saccharibacteria bacterium]
MNIIGRRKLWYSIALGLVIPLTLFLSIHGLKLGLDFKGGQELEVSGIDQPKLEEIANSNSLGNYLITTSGQSNLLIRYDQQDNPEEVRESIKSEIEANGGKEESYNSIGPSISSEITTNAIKALVIASIAIMLYIAFAFRNLPSEVDPLSFGIIAIIAMLHDALILFGSFSVLGYYFGVEIDSLFITAVLTVIGFSVHDTIVVFDRVRENISKLEVDYTTEVNTSVVETMARSMNTSLTVLITLAALWIFGGESIKNFVLALLIGITAGTYSSIFIASPLLVTWQKFKQRFQK